jgi:CubicO group peptidase (beta-lactamase class C family)
VSCAFVTNSGQVWSRGFGVTDTATNEPVTAQTIFQAASLTKPVFAYAVLGLVERKVLDLDRPIAPYLPDDLIRKESQLELVTARMFLSHTSGVAGELDAPTFNFSPGRRFEYAPLGFRFMQLAVERLTGQSLARFMQSNALEPAGMHSSSVGWSVTRWWRAARGHFRNGESRRNRIDWYPTAAGSLLTTASDYARFMRGILRSEGDGTHISNELKREMLKPQVRIADGLAWGLGWGLEDAALTRAFWHWGDQDNFNNFALMDAARRTGVVILTNSVNGAHAYDPIVSTAIGGEHPALSWVQNYPDEAHPRSDL